MARRRSLSWLLWLQGAVVHMLTVDDAGPHANYPLQYQVHKLTASESIVIDGHADDGAWGEVAWSEAFQDIEGSLLKPRPRFETKVKMRYDSECLYILAQMIEPQAWANLTERNSVIFTDNDFEIFCDPDGSNSFYKEFEINAFATAWNLLLVSPYLNGGPAVCNYTTPNQCAGSDAEHNIPYFDIGPALKVATAVDGHLNDPERGSQSWTVEACLPLTEYAKFESSSVHVPPKDGEMWRINFSRVQYKVVVHTQEDGKKVYWKEEGVAPDNWVWQPQGVVNMHLPERWGYIRFSEHKPADPGPRDPLWPVRWCLMEVYSAEKTYASLFGTSYTASLEALVLNAGLPMDVATGRYASAPTITLTPSGGFQVSVASKEVAGAMGYIAQNRTIWFKGLSNMLSANPNDMAAQRRREQVEVHLNGGQEG